MVYSTFVYRYGFIFVCFSVFLFGMKCVNTFKIYLLRIHVHCFKYKSYTILLLDKPTPPQGPLEVSDITPETCSLSWKPPLDDGGSPITNYTVEKLDTSTGVSISLDISLHFYCKNFFTKIYKRLSALLILPLLLWLL